MNLPVRLYEVRAGDAAQKGAMLGCERRASGLLEIRADDTTDGPDFWGPLLPFMVTDSYGTLFAADAFRDGGVDSDPYAFLWMHDPWDVAGTFTAEVRDEHIWIEGLYDDTPSGHAARARGKSGSARGMSIGFERLADEPYSEGRTLITKARMVEGSQITTRMESVPGAGLAGVRRQHASEESAASMADLDRQALLALRLRLVAAGR